MPCTVMNRQRTHRDIDLEKKLESNSEGERGGDQRYPGTETGGLVWADGELEGFS